MAVFFKVMDKEEHITRMIDLKNGKWHHLNTMISDKRKDASICMYHFIYIHVHFKPIRMYVAVTSLLLFIPVESFYRYINVNRIMLYSTLHTKRQISKEKSSQNKVVLI